jgi:hypothetical protein
MNRARAVMLVAAVVLAAGVAGVATTTAHAGTTECKSIKNCIDVVGPWVIVPAHSEATYLLTCPPKGQTIGGTDSMATSADVRVTFDGLLGGPIAPGLTTEKSAYFRAVSGHGRIGAFQPRLGCIPSQSGGRQTTSARVASPGPLTLTATTVNVVAGNVERTLVRCPHGSQFISSWDATAFRTTKPPDLALAGEIRITRTDSASGTSASIGASETLPANAHAQVQLGVICAG